MQTMSRTNLTNNGVKVLHALHDGAIHNKDVAEALEVTQAAVSQSLARLKAGGYVRKMKNGELKMTAKGERALEGGPIVGPRPGSKMEAAMKVVAKYATKKPRKAILEKLISEVELTKAGAATYYSILTHKLAEKADEK